MRTMRFIRLVACACLVLAGAVALAGPAQAVTRTGGASPFYLEANTGYCLSTKGSDVVINKCSGSDYQQWYPVKNYTPDDTNPMWQQKESNLCLTAPYYTAHSWLSIDTCHDQTSKYDGTQTFTTVGTDDSNITSINAWYYHKSHMCFGVAKVATGQQVELLPCNYSDNDQRWDKYAA